MHDKKIICVFDNTLSEEVLQKMAENDQIFKLGILFDPNVKDLSKISIDNEIVIGKTG